MSAANCLVANDWVCGEYFRTRGQDLVDATLQHIGITVAAVVIGVLIAFPLAVLAHRRRAFAAPVLAVTTLFYTIPSLAMFSLLLPLFGLSAALVITGLVLYSLTILVRNTLAGLDAVPEEAREAATGMGYGPWRLLWEVEVPLALPALLAGAGSPPSPPSPSPRSAPSSTTAASAPSSSTASTPTSAPRCSPPRCSA